MVSIVGRRISESSCLFGDIHELRFIVNGDAGHLDSPFASWFSLLDLYLISKLSVDIRANYLIKHPVASKFALVRTLVNELLSVGTL